MLALITKATNDLKSDMDGAAEALTTCLDSVSENAETGAKIIGDKLNTCLA